MQPAAFGQLAKSHGGDGSETGPQLILDLMNEPHSMPSADVLANLNAAVAAVRKLGLRNLLLLEGNDWTGLHAWTQGDGTNPPNSQVFTRAKIQDPMDHYAINVHQYLDEDSSGSHEDCVPPSQIGAKLNFAPFVSWMRSEGMRVFLSEFGAPYNPDCISDEKLLMALVANASSAGGLSDPGFIGWTVWAAGHAWGNSYAFGVNAGDQAQAMVVAGLGEHLLPPDCSSPGFMLAFNGTPAGMSTSYSV